MVQGSPDGFEKHAGKIIASLVTAGIIAGVGAQVNVDKRLALVEQKLETAAEDRWTASMQHAYAAQVKAEYEAVLLRVTRNERDIATIKDKRD